MKNYWLIKSEPSEYSWQQLQTDGKTDWTGVRNYAARNNLREMQKGDLAFSITATKVRSWGYSLFLVWQRLVVTNLGSLPLNHISVGCKAIAIRLAAIPAPTPELLRCLAELHKAGDKHRFAAGDQGLQ